MKNAHVDSLNQQIELALQNGTYALQGEFLYGSNRTFLCSLTYEDQNIGCVYKPARGERPLWDFETGSLARREVAAYLLDQALGWYAVPPCVLRDDGPFGPGSLHWFVEHDPEHHYFTFSDEQKNNLQSVFLFDLIINNADRKAGHFLLDPQGKIWLIDHGLSFHVEDKLRTVVWDFAGIEIEPSLLDELINLQEQLESDTPLQERIRMLISEEEFTALISRIREIKSMKTFPAPSEERRMIPWPLV